ncbi:MAG TPA: iron-containing redox enzyme family protein [Caulobacter sp.]|nr:iron-containing redox enzyme family protein [Caulobacter sp.]
MADDLAFGAGPAPAFDGRIDTATGDDPVVATLVAHQTLLRAYQARYVVLPETLPGASVVEAMARHYAPDRLRALTEARPTLETRLIGPLAAQADAAEPKTDVLAYIDHLLTELRSVNSDAVLDRIDGHPRAEAHYRNFLVQSSADLLAEASASALGVIGEYGAPQSALFRILIDEFGYGTHDRKHAVLYRSTLRSFGLDDAYNRYWPLFDGPTLALHNTIHWLFQNPANFFRQIGFLLFAETAYQRSTLCHSRFLARAFPKADARYFTEHAHIDLHHTRMVIDEVVVPLLDRFGPEIGQEIVRGAELTRLVFRLAGDNAVALVGAFDAAGGDARYGLEAVEGGRLVSPAGAGIRGRVQVGAIGTVSARTFGAFPVHAVGRLVEVAT